MRVAALYDIHASLPALEAVLDEVRRLDLDIVGGGDVMPGPMPRETLALLRALAVRVEFIRGNGETAVIEQLSGRTPARVPEALRPLIAWTAGQLDEDRRRFVAAWPATRRMTLPPLGDVLFCHATPDSEDDIFTRLTPEAALRTVFDRTAASLVVCGHTHMPFDRRIGATRVVNAGSVGMPFGRPGADWLVLDTDVRPQHTEYDRDAAARRIRATTYPSADEFVSRNVLEVPSEQAMLAAFARVEISGQD